MRTFTEYIGSQFGNPRGLIGNICCKIMNNINKRMYHSIVDCIKPDKKLTILDIGYGNGYLIEQLSKKKTAKIYGIDISEDMKNAASKRNKDAIAKGEVTLDIGDCCKLQFEDELFDVVTSVNTIYFWENTMTGLKEIHRVLKEQGVFYNAVYSKKWMQSTSFSKRGFQLYEKEDYIKLGKEAGFSKVSVKEIIPGKSYLIRYIK